MAKQFEDEVAYYYDFHPTEEDLMGETAVHRNLVSYLAFVLRWQFRGQRRLTGEEAEARRAEALAEKLRSLGIDPNQL